MHKLGLAALASLAVLGTGCGPTCQATCNRLYQEADPNCNIQSVAMDRSELLTECNNACEDALDVPGEIGDYTPHEYTPSSKSITLENDKQAALWMDCVAETSCEHLNDGYCAPVW